MIALPSTTHRVAPLQSVPPGNLLIHEIYLSVQGESTFAGLPCVFVRTTVCDLRCVWCDTPHAFTRGEQMTRADVLARALAFDCPLVELTGGEPLLQPAVLPLMTDLCDAGKTVLLETSGAHPVGPVDPRVHIIMDLKCPDSGECDRNLWANLDVLKPTDQIKFVIASRRDWDWAADTIRAHNLDKRFHVLVGTVFGDATPRDLVEWLLASGLNIRMQLQMHKYIWDPAARGV
ncbi:radical SAM protein [Fimbriiglobus ruber]|uniref:7-carboxy-7-deazaguanine synthase n=1 Tax=Fimbriiglobus ruber TaxID=1908690 RepID=A0A225DBR5_9BACT|nr:radical SAM protein [Fimbriiglobus ruber]OWK35968.1 Queuosine Biosynthesis QueE Radical SAM [Fimbriiglobus ruber]